MIKALKIIASSLVIVSLATFLYLEYRFRDQDLKLELIPTEFTHCGRAISRHDEKYEEIVNLLTNNKNGWVESPVTFLERDVYISPSFRVNLLEDVVVVSFKDGAEYRQLAKSIDHRIKAEKCSSSS